MGDRHQEAGGDRPFLPVEIRRTEYFASTPIFRPNQALAPGAALSTYKWYPHNSY